MGKVSRSAWLSQPSLTYLNFRKQDTWDDDILKLCYDGNLNYFHSAESHSNWDVFPTQLIYENWDEDEPNNYEELEHCVTLSRSPNMRWNDLRCDHLVNWICEIKKGMITFPFN